MPAAVFLVDVVADHPAEGASDEDVGRKVLLAEDAGDADTSCYAVERKLIQCRWIFIGKHGRTGPCQHAEIRGKRPVDADAGLKELAPGSVDVRPLAHEDQLHALLDDEAVDEGFAAENAGLACMIALGQVPYPIHHGRSGDEGARLDVG